MDERITRFWDQKILQWERDKYQKSPRFLDFNRPLKARKKVAANFLESRGAGKSVTELGCGSGLMLEEIRDLPLRSYHGVDISPVAIGEAKKRAVELKLRFPVSFRVSSVKNLLAEELSTDLCFSLGLTDWLGDEELRQLCREIRSPRWFHSYSSPERTWQVLAHRLYVFLLYGHRNRTYTPAYRDEAKLKSLIPGGFLVYSDRALGVGKIVHNLEIDGE